MRNERTEPNRVFSIYIPNSLYQKIVDKAGRGRISTFIKQVLEKELENQQKEQKEQLIEAYKREAENKEVQEEMAILEGVASDSINDE